MKRRYMPRVTACVMALLFVVVSACSSHSTSSNESSSPSPSGQPTKASFPRTIASAKGDITISKKPERVALVHWGLTQALLSFDIPSIGVALPFTEKQSVLDNTVYKPYTSKFKEIKIVGENTEVNLEILLQYAPDLIIAGTETNQKVADQLAKIAPTVFLDEKKMDVWNDWQGVMTKFGEMLGQEDTAKQAIDTFAAKIAQAKDQLKHVQGSVAYLQVREKQMLLQGTKSAGASERGRRSAYVGRLNSNQSGLFVPGVL